VIRIEQNYKLISEKSLVSLAVSRYDADTVGFVQFYQGGQNKQVAGYVCV
jgi:hypothetical protein